MDYFKNFPGKIKGCKKYIRKCPCCEIGKVKIYILPGELEASNLNKSNIKIINDNYFGGKLAICNKFCSVDDFKPFDCKSYPYSPFINEAGELVMKKSTRCPLPKKELAEHKKEVSKMWKKIIKNSRMKDWVKNIEYEGYEYVDE